MHTLTRRFKNFSASSWALVVVLLFPFFSIVTSPLMFKGFDRFGYQWHVLLLGCLLASSFVLLDSRFFPFLKQLLSYQRVRFGLVGFISWLIVLVAAHGIMQQLESLLSVSLVILMAPVLFFSLRHCHQDWNIGFISLCLLLVIVFVDNLCLSIYYLSGINFNLISHSESLPPRLFLNTREGDFLALVQFQLLCSSFFYHLKVKSAAFFQSKYSLLLIGFAAFQPLYRAWLTQGRGLLCCAALSMIFLFLQWRLRKKADSRVLFFVSISSYVLAWVVYRLARLCAGLFSGIDSSALVSLLQRADGGRLDLWGIWLQSGFSNSLWFGHGLGVIPEANNTIQFTPHSVVIQLFADAGILGVLLFCFLNWVFPFLRAFGLSRNAQLFYPIMLNLFFISSVLFWSSGVWALSLFLVSMLQFTCLNNSSALINLDISNTQNISALQVVYSSIYFVSVVLSVICLSSLKYLVY